MRAAPLLALTLLLALPARAEPPVVLEGLRQPRVALGAKGRVYVAGLQGGDVVVRTSTDGGASFGAPRIALDAHHQARGGRRRGPRIGVSAKGELIVTAPVCFDRQELRRRFPRAELWLVRSTDGVTWSKPVRVNDTPRTASEALHELVVAPDGTAHVVWLDHRRADQGNELWSARVTAAGVGKNVRLTGPVCECCAPALAVDREGRLTVLVRGRTLRDRPMLGVRSADGGRTFTRPRQRNELKTGIGG